MMDKIIRAWEEKILFLMHSDLPKARKFCAHLVAQSTSPQYILWELLQPVSISQREPQDLMRFVWDQLDPFMSLGDQCDAMKHFYYRLSQFNG